MQVLQVRKERHEAVSFSQRDQVRNEDLGYGAQQPTQLKANSAINKEIKLAYRVSKEFLMKTCLSHKTF